MTPTLATTTPKKRGRTWSVEQRKAASQRLKARYNKNTEEGRAQREAQSKRATKQFEGRYDKNTEEGRAQRAAQSKRATARRDKNTAEGRAWCEGQSKRVTAQWDVNTEKGRALREAASKRNDAWWDKETPDGLARREAQSKRATEQFDVNTEEGRARREAQSKRATEQFDVNTEEGRARREAQSKRSKANWLDWRYPVQKYIAMCRGMNARTHSNLIDDMRGWEPASSYKEIIQRSRRRAEAQADCGGEICNMHHALEHAVGREGEKTLEEIKKSLTILLQHAVQIVGPGGEICGDELCFQLYIQTEAISYTSLANVSEEEVKAKGLLPAAVGNFHQKFMLHSSFRHGMSYNLKPISSTCNDPGCLINNKMKLYLGYSFVCQEGRGTIGFCKSLPGSSSGEASFLWDLTGTHPGTHRRPEQGTSTQGICPDMRNMDALASILFQASKNQLEDYRFMHEAFPLPFWFIMNTPDPACDWIWGPRRLGKWKTYTESTCDDIAAAVQSPMRISCRRVPN